jgi:TRAP-type uncharacterized transport system substrate-binding protein
MKAALPDFDVVNEETSGSLVVLSSLQEGKGDFGFSLADAAYVAYRHGSNRIRPHTNVRAIAVRWVNSFYAIVPARVLIEPWPIFGASALASCRVAVPANS